MQSNLLSVKQIIIKNLFGKYSYNIEVEQENIKDPLNILILYGNNGSGKTTILKLLYHLLSPIDSKGHKTFIAKTSFQKFQVYLTNGLTITAERPEGTFIGSYNLSIKNEKGVDIEIFLNASFDDDDGYSIKVKGRKEKRLSGILDYLSDLNIALYFLSDSRDFESNIFEKGKRIYLENLTLSELERLEGFREPVRIRTKKISRALIREAIDRAERWINTQVNLSMSKGELDVNKIYSTIIETLSHSDTIEKVEPEYTQKLIIHLRDLAERSKNYAKFEIISILDVEKIISSLKKAHSRHISTIKTVINPYIESIEAKLDALENIYNILNIFTSGLNSFYNDKTVEFKLNKGIEIIVDDQNLNPELLSSGEKQLLLLFCNILPARDYASIFIIDEPEISLNVKWQRNLVKALIGLTRDSQIQYIFATHSIELLTQYDEYVVDLININ